MEIKDKFGDFIRKLRKARGFSRQKDFAEATGLSGASISRIENNAQIPEPDTLKIFAKVLNFSYADLMVKAGYYDEEDLLGEEIKLITHRKKQQNEDLFIKSLDLNDEDLLEKFELRLDGKPLSKEEAKSVIAFLRSLRSLN